MKYATLKQERDEAIARAVEAERLSMKSEVDRLIKEYEEAIAAIKKGYETELLVLRRRVLFLRSALSTSRAAATAALDNDSDPSYELRPSI